MSIVISVFTASTWVAAHSQVHSSADIHTVHNCIQDIISSVQAIVYRVLGIIHVLCNVFYRCCLVNA